MKRITWPRKSEEVVVRRPGRGLPPPPGQELREREKNAETWGRELGEPDGHGGGQGSRSSGRRLGGGMCSATTEEGPRAKLESEGLVWLLFLAGNLFQETPRLGLGPGPGPAGATTHTHTAVHIYTCSLFLCRVDSSLWSRPGHHCLSLI